MSYNFLVKTIIVGDSRVGKSCLLLQFTENRFKEQHDLTIGVEFGSRLVHIEGGFIKMQIWDTAGQESFRSITRAYYRGAAGALVVFDVTNRTSFESLNTWVREVKQNGTKECIIVVLANKVDQTGERCVSTEEAMKFAQENSIIYAETSAMDKESIENVFTLLAQEIFTKVKGGLVDPNDQNVGVRFGNLNRD